jgi:hypothetical protein
MQKVKFKIKTMKKEKTLGIVRHALTFVGGVLVTQGILDDAMFMELFGAVMTLIGGVWSVVDKKVDSEK